MLLGETRRQGKESLLTITSGQSERLPKYETSKAKLKLAQLRLCVFVSKMGKIITYKLKVNNTRIQAFKFLDFIYEVFKIYYIGLI